VPPACPCDFHLELWDSKVPASYWALAAGLEFETPQAPEAGWLETGWVVGAGRVVGVCQAPEAGRPEAGRVVEVG